MARYEKGSYSVTPNKNHIKGRPAAMQAIYFWICDHADEKGVCFPSRKTLAEEAGVDIKTLDKYIEVLEKEGFIQKISRKKEGTNQHTSNLYQVMIIEGGVAPKTVLGGTENGARGGTENGTGTIPSIELIPLNQESDVPSPYKKFIFEDIDFMLATQLRDCIKKNTPTFKEPSMDMWAHHMRLMRTVDRRTEEQIMFLINWTQQDSFWQANILSPKKLREKFDTLVAQVKRKVNEEKNKKAKVAFA